MPDWRHVAAVGLSTRQPFHKHDLQTCTFFAVDTKPF
jgi:hypothetical protein